MRVVFAGTPEFALPALEALRTHHELLAAQGAYAKLWLHQSGGFLTDPDPAEIPATA